MNLKAFLGGDRVSLQHSNRVTVTEDRREIVALMDALHEHREVWLPSAEGSSQLLKTLWVHRSTVLGHEGRIAARNYEVDVISRGKHGESVLV